MNRMLCPDAGTILMSEWAPRPAAAFPREAPTHHGCPTEAGNDLVHLPSPMCPLTQELSLPAALAVATEAGTDLVLLPSKTDPPVALVVGRSSLRDNPGYVLERLKLTWVW